MRTLLITLLLLISSNLYSQQLRWRQLNGAPENSIKLDDGYFINETTGWVINGLNQPGEVYRTTNGGYTWQMQYTTTSGFRSIGFGDSLTGWIGSLTTGKILYRTTNGGINWVQLNNFSPAPSGICGIYTFDKNTMYACGRYDGPAHFMKTTNGGANWTVKNLSPLATSIVDIHFLNKDSGFVTGGIGLPIFSNARTVILFTSDGGNTWVTRYTGTHLKEWGWKFSFLSNDVGFAAVESYRFEDSISYIKTTDRGASWIEHRFKIDSSSYHAEGIFFKDSNTGWIGGYYSGGGGPPINGPTYETTNGGATWQPQHWGFNLNRFRRVNDNLIYGMGKTVYKYSQDSTVNIQVISSEIPAGFTLHQNYPNPFNPVTYVGFELPASEFVSLKIYDIQGRIKQVLVNKNLNAGSYRIYFDGSTLSSGMYFYKLEAGEFTSVKKMMLVK